MKQPLAILTLALSGALAAGLSGCMAAAEERGGAESAEVSPMRARAEARLARELEDKTAGPPQACITRFEAERMDSPTEEVLLFRASNSLVYVNRPETGCPATGGSRRIERRSIGSNLCRGEAFQVVDNQSGAYVGSCILGDFVPYRR